MNLNLFRGLRVGSHIFGPKGQECSKAVVDPPPSLVTLAAPSRLTTWTTGRRQPEHRPHDTARHPRRDLYQTVDYRIPGTTRTR